MPGRGTDAELAVTAGSRRAPDLDRRRRGHELRRRARRELRRPVHARWLRPARPLTTTRGLTNGTTYAYRLRTCPNQVSACMTVVPVGASAGYQAGSAAVTADTGDHDLIPDNCELVTMTLNVVNDGSVDLTGVRLNALASSHPGVQIATAMPQTVGNLAVGQSAPVSVSFNLRGERKRGVVRRDAPVHGQPSSRINLRPACASFSLQAEKDAQIGTITLRLRGGFLGVDDLDRDFHPRGGGAPGPRRSPSTRAARTASATRSSLPCSRPRRRSTMNMWVNFSIEGNAAAGSRWDRAVVRVVNTTNGTKTLIASDGWRTTRPAAIRRSATGSAPSRVGRATASSGRRRASTSELRRNSDPDRGSLLDRTTHSGRRARRRGSGSTRCRSRTPSGTVATLSRTSAWRSRRSLPDRLADAADDRQGQSRRDDDVLRGRRSATAYHIYAGTLCVPSVRGVRPRRCRGPLRPHRLASPETVA